MTFFESPTSDTRKWVIYVDGASSSTGSGAGIILESGEATLIKVSLTLYLPNSNNQAEYEALQAGLSLTEDVGAEDIRIFTYS